MQVVNPNMAVSPASTRQLMWQGIAWKFFSCACFAGMNALVRYLSGSSPLTDEALPVYVLIFFQNLIGSICLLPWIVKQGFGVLKTSQPLLHISRLTLALLGVSFWYFSLKYMPVTEAVALGFMSPIITIIGARVFLNESLSIKRWTAIGLTFLGAFLIARPDSTLSDKHIGIAAMLPIVSACFFACSKLITRRLAASGESTSILTAYLLFFMAPVSLVPALLTGWAMPTMAQWPAMIAMGILATLAYFSFNRAYSYAEVTFLMPFGAVKFLLSAIIGFLAFTEIPTSYSSWSGIALIAACTTFLSYQSSRNKAGL